MREDKQYKSASPLLQDKARWRRGRHLCQVRSCRHARFQRVRTRRRASALPRRSEMLHHRLPALVADLHMLTLADFLPNPRALVERPQSDIVLVVQGQR